MQVGSGAGLPGLILAIARPQWQVSSLAQSSEPIHFTPPKYINSSFENAQLDPSPSQWQAWGCARTSDIQSMELQSTSSLKKARFLEHQIIRTRAS